MNHSLTTRRTTRTRASNTGYEPTRADDGIRDAVGLTDAEWLRALLS
jgi:hypothetical protein